MLRLVSAITLLLVPASAMSAGPFTGADNKSGINYEYTSSVAPTGVIEIAGNYLPSGDKFALTVEPSGRVHGTVRDESVEFWVTKAKRDRIVASSPASPAIMTASTVQLIGASAQ